MPVLAPGTGEVRTDWLWVVLRDQRGWGGGDPPIVVFHHARSRAGQIAQEILKGFSGGTLLVDGHGGYDQLADPKKTVRPWDIARAIVLEPMANDSALLDALAAPLRQVRQGYAVGNLRRDGRAHCAALCH
ncbi:IS66 family transposase [Rhodobacter capsulatus]|uniref:IS66 family transposase n=1 Tax=Rhodobacter capsulatus TaxID=1061 RepID=UPI00373FDF69